MIRLRTALLTAGTFLTAFACSSNDANLGDGMGAVNGAGGTAGSAGNVDKDAAVGTGGSAGTSSAGAAGCASGVSCTTGAGGGTGSGGGTGGSPPIADSGSVEASGALTWRTTCGDSVCHVGGDVDSGIASCSADQKAGNPCAMAGSVCDPGLGCGQKMMCADHRLDTMCPISNRNKKQDVRYLSREDLESLADEVSKVRLTTYTYRDPSLGTDEHLGFIIEDNPKSPAVYPNQHHVDLYGYASMAVAALQVQSEQLRAQQQQMADLRREVSTLRDELRRSHESMCQP